ncbi:glyoxalase [Flavobacterium capsici]|uniref:Glyoxalase n=1 Tax=Flavobacterium capsici TaxID=3075618 RepID=A0AA96ETW0_9FLAO|nr:MULTISPECIES: glyoxalase [unclassified Flavobacterium]WNM18156.1 glyoxalase [Flavobacterium sp. PMR2A8]WNM22208.1 glyoxalase [Flavobacterium sp. PMTSA4]
MENRDSHIIALRGETIGSIDANTSHDEIFQNRTLRPILKTQNDLFIAVFINYAVKQKNVFFSLSPEKKMAYIENVIQRDIKFRNSLKGIIIGLFTVEEYNDYIQNSSNLNKRMMNMLIERLKNQVLLLENDNLQHKAVI